ncbi:unnamed protein product [Allacma fusca]|uniref:Sm domain-containing protein n=2 Tax=Allacma fusca TaxID=39272 RepID=A0A8J2K8W7_9HEXA|nr:unnamed protein product [Allacma fusca]
MTEISDDWRGESDPLFDVIMGVAIGPREKAIFSNSLAPVLLGLCGHTAVVEFKQEIQVAGKIIAVDCFTNITMENAVMTRLNGTQACFEIFFIPMRSIRSVRVPDYISMINVLKDQVALVSGAKLKEERRKAKLRQEKLRLKRQQQQAAKEAKRVALLIPPPE